MRIFRQIRHLYTMLGTDFLLHMVNAVHQYKLAFVQVWKNTSDIQFSEHMQCLPHVLPHIFHRVYGLYPFHISGTAASHLTRCRSIRILCLFLFLILCIFHNSRIVLLSLCSKTPHCSYHSICSSVRTLFSSQYLTVLTINCR